MTDDIYDDGTPDESGPTSGKKQVKATGKPQKQQDAASATPAADAASGPTPDAAPDAASDTPPDAATNAATDVTVIDVQTGVQDEQDQVARGKAASIEVAVPTPPRAGDDARALDFEGLSDIDADNPGGSESSDTPDPTDGPELPVLPDELPVLPVRDVVVFNYMILPLFVGREKSVQAVDAALNGSRYLMICTQRDESVDDPAPEDLHPTGTVVMIMRMLKMPDNRLKVLVQGISRARVESFGVGDGYLTARVETLPEPELGPPTVEQEAMMRAAREQSEKILSLRGIATSDIMAVLNSVDDPGRLADLIAANLRMKVSDAQAILECTDPDPRLRLVNEQLVKEVEVASMQAKIQSMAREGMDKAQKDYFLREQMKAIRRELGESGNEDEELEDLTRALERAGLPREVRKEADKQLRRLASMHPDSSEATVVRTYLEWLAELPWAKLSRDRLDINKAKVILDEDHLGLAKVKDRILEYLSVRKLNPKSKGPILCFAGPPGVGKTSLGRSIARAMGRKFQRISLGGMRDEAEIRGHRRTYIGAMPGRIVQSLKQLGTRNPVLMLDEIDKIGSDFRGDPSSALLEVLDPEQNFSFSDHYLNVPFDLSKVMFICTANQLDTIPAPLRDRMEVISIPGYTMQEKLAIARRYLLPRQAKENGLSPREVTVPDALIERIITGYTREAGLRNLEREIGSLCRKVARRKAEGEKGPFRVTPRMLEKLLGAPRFIDEEKEAELLPGVALGLAWTPYGGEVLHVEVTPMKGKGSVTMTGQLGDVMKESAQAAISYARSRAERLGIEPDFSEKLDLHIHVPAGATPKDGPSAGVTMVTALLSAITGKPVRSDLCMTGEITLRGRVLPVGGIKEKILAGVARGMQHVIIPRQNVKDLEDIPADLLRRIQVHPVAHIDDLLPLAFPKGE
ncbi:endopeptidase La [Nitratidesulfovibrio liaohensis]|uniref:endopeptidase La n=1 Tax=Nitratidesulfovibrio liaohensis TaxID=2604158 RepID=UPI001424488A|nr:endopeptidase La [Nitratidesulfovibrio liaohensis]NHZ46050.1 endopeptidase La [Nitratidesulfovibrio liaohensis]